MIDYAWSLRNMGSSPLARGKSYPDRFRNGNEGFIPTRAGKIRGTLTILLRVTVHPHSRGENGVAAMTSRSDGGSSPLARGKCTRGQGHRRSDGFIPTRAGKIWPASPTCATSPVHPHSRGENATPSILSRFFCGSSPLARGKSAT